MCRAAPLLQCGAQLTFPCIAPRSPSTNWSSVFLTNRFDIVSFFEFGKLMSKKQRMRSSSSDRMVKSKRGASRVLALRWPLLLMVGAVLLLAVFQDTFVQQCEAVEMCSASAGSELKSGEGDCKSKGAGGVAAVKEEVADEEEEEEFEFDELDELDDNDDGEDGEIDEYDGEEGEEDEDEEDEDEEDEDEDESDFEGEDFEDEFAGEEGSESKEPEEKTFDETDVVVLGRDNFTEFVKSNGYVFVEFYAPWCGACKALAPQYAEAATLLKGKAVLAKVDATANDDLAREFSVTSYPTLFFFIDGLHKKYPGHNAGNEIVDFVTKKTSLTVVKLLSKDDAELIFDSQKSTLAIALLSSLEGPEVEEFTASAKQEDDVLFYLTNSAEVAGVFNIPSDIKRPALVLLKQEPEKVSWFDGPFKRDAISAFVTKHKLPLIVTFTKQTAALIFQSPIKKQIIFFAGRDDFDNLKTDFMEASKALLGKLVFVHVDLDDSEQAPQITEFFGLNADKPAVMGFETQENGKKFLLEGDITAQNVKAFGEDFVSDSLRPYYKSDPVPETNDEDVKIVVGKNFDDIVLDETKDVFFELYQPTCSYCQALEPIWNKLARRLRGVDSIVIAKMDDTTNEHDRAKQDGYPTLLFYPAGKKSFDPITFSGDRTVKEFIKFLKREAAIPFTVPKKSDTQEPLPTSELESTTESVKPKLESETQDSWSSVKDEL